MLKKITASILIGTVTLMAVPRTNLAQTQQNSTSDVFLRDAGKTEKRDLKASFSAEMANIKSSKLSEKDLFRTNSKSQQQQPKSGFSKKDKMFLALWIVLTAGLVAVLIKHGCKGENKCDDPILTDY